MLKIKLKITRLLFSQFEKMYHWCAFKDRKERKTLGRHGEDEKARFLGGHDRIRELTVLLYLQSYINSTDTSMHNWGRRCWTKNIYALCLCAFYVHFRALEVFSHIKGERLNSIPLCQRSRHMSLWKLRLWKLENLKGKSTQNERESYQLRLVRESAQNQETFSSKSSWTTVDKTFVKTFL